MFLTEKLAVIHSIVPYYIKWWFFFSLWLLLRFYFRLWFSVVWLKLPRFVFLIFILIGVHWAAFICNLIFFHQIWEILGHNSSDVFCLLLFLFCFWDSNYTCIVPYTHNSDHLSLNDPQVTKTVTHSFPILFYFSDDIISN